MKSEPVKPTGATRRDFLIASAAAAAAQPLAGVLSVSSVPLAAATQLPSVVPPPLVAFASSMGNMHALFWLPLSRNLQLDEENMEEYPSSQKELIKLLQKGEVSMAVKTASEHFARDLAELTEFRQHHAAVESAYGETGQFRQLIEVLSNDLVKKYEHVLREIEKCDGEGQVMVAGQPLDREAIKAGCRKAIQEHIREIKTIYGKLEDEEDAKDTTPITLGELRSKFQEIEAAIKPEWSYDIPMRVAREDEHRYDLLQQLDHCAHFLKPIAPEDRIVHEDEALNIRHPMLFKLFKRERDWNDFLPELLVRFSKLKKYTDCEFMEEVYDGDNDRKITAAEEIQWQRACDIRDLITWVTSPYYEDELDFKGTTHPEDDYGRYYIDEHLVYLMQHAGESNNNFEEDEEDFRDFCRSLKVKPKIFREFLTKFYVQNRSAIEKFVQESYPADMDMEDKDESPQGFMKYLDKIYKKLQERRNENLVQTLKSLGIPADGDESVQENLVMRLARVIQLIKAVKSAASPGDADAAPSAGGTAHDPKIDAAAKYTLDNFASVMRQASQLSQDTSNFLALCEQWDARPEDVRRFLDVLHTQNRDALVRLAEIVLPEESRAAYMETLDASAAALKPPAAVDNPGMRGMPWTAAILDMGKDAGAGRGDDTPPPALSR